MNPPPSKTSRGPLESIPVAAARVGVSRMIVHRWIASGHLTSYRAGKGLLHVDPEELVRLLTLGTATARPRAGGKVRT